ncbi:MAG: hypothetical protein KDC85_02070 [Saprospiraceae bacterium]|nr:hypothetical protein [Saprospiraceae bacterium]MCB9325681.1 hypothetical protein [Lewinellaceae bacterium]
MRYVFTIFFLTFLTFGFGQNQHEKSVLFIGNSFTFFNDMPFIFRDISDSFGKKVFVDTLVKQGQNLSYHARQKGTYDKIKSRKWDFVVIQGHSDEFAQPESVINQKTLPFARQIIDSIMDNNPCAKIIFYMTWGYKNGNPRWQPISSYQLMQEVIEKEYLRFSDIFSASIAPVGMVWEDVFFKNPGLNLYNADLHHPSLLGSYLSACTFYASIFGVSPMNCPLKMQLPDEERRVIELSASQVVLNNLNKWRWAPIYPEMQTGFDLILQNKALELVNRAQNYRSIQWHFGDGDTTEETDPKHVYNENGSYLIIQRVSNECYTLQLERKIEVN